MPNCLTGIGQAEIALGCLFALIFWMGDLSNNQGQRSRVEDNTFISPDNPEIRVSVDKKFKYVGSLPFTIDDVAAGFRYVFVEADSKKQVRRMFIVQQEGFLPSSNDTYKYRITSPAKLGGVDYQHSVILDDNNARIREEPGKEAEITQRFLTLHGYVLEPEVIMSRFARPTDSQHKHEIIFFCYENLSSYGHRLSDFAHGSHNHEEQDIKDTVDKNCRAAFDVNH